MQLYIGNKNYSSWSLRPWLLMKHAGIAFEEKKVRLGWEDDSPFKKTMLALAPSGRVPLLIDDGFPIWDSLAIAETLAERLPEKSLWPRDAKARARARSLCAEMHSGFGELRSAFGMNLEARLPEIGERILREKPGAARDLKRIDAMWREALEDSGGPFLFGAFSIADAFFAPVCTRVRTYGLPLAPRSAEYVRQILALPAFLEWEREALAEHDWIAEDELYRQAPA
jgi:glutathione S-transferase